VFWSGKSIETKGNSLVQPFSKNSIDCAAYKLRIGPEIYVTPHVGVSDSHTVTKRKLSDSESFTIPAGQFAFLLTEESLTIPYTQIGFISIRAQIKFKGLVNVSGFHVDPGYTGRLIFSVFNAGPAPLHLQRGEEIFLLWIADLDQCASLDYAKSDSPREDIPNKLINSIPGEIHSFQSLSKMITEQEKEINKEINSVRNEVKITSAKVSVYLVFFTIVIGFLLRGPIFEELGNLAARFSSNSHEPQRTEEPAQQQTE